VRGQLKVGEEDEGGSEPIHDGRVGDGGLDVWVLERIVRSTSHLGRRILYFLASVHLSQRKLTVELIELRAALYFSLSFGQTSAVPGQVYD
jgi:hypothetical protein